MENPGDNMLEKSIVVSDGGGAGMIVVDLHNDYDKGKGEYYPIPTSVINQGEADKLGNYVASFRYFKIVVLYFSQTLYAHFDRFRYVVYRKSLGSKSNYIYYSIDVPIFKFVDFFFFKFLTTIKYL